jgi:hypothetical protein
VDVFPFFDLLQKVCKHYRNTGSKAFLSIPRHGAIRGSSPGAHPLGTIPDHVPDSTAWEPAHHPGCNF